jgi:hypothetical protein
MLSRSPEGGKQGGAGIGRGSSQGGGTGFPPAGPATVMIRGWRVDAAMSRSAFPRALFEDSKDLFCPKKIAVEGKRMEYWCWFCKACGNYVLMCQVFVCGDLVTGWCLCLRAVVPPLLFWVGPRCFAQMEEGGLVGWRV